MLCRPRASAKRVPLKECWFEITFHSSSSLGYVFLARKLIRVYRFFRVCKVEFPLEEERMSFQERPVVKNYSSEGGLPD
jgi:hypothetical protein